MSESVTILIGNSIRGLREERKMSQTELAEKMNMARPGLSKWENGKSEPSSSQLVKLAKILGVSTDTLVGNNTDSNSVVVVDTSALIKRPSIIDELCVFFDEVIIPEVVISELNNLKDRSAVKQKAWLVMKSISDTKERFVIAPNIGMHGKNDEKIAAIAKQRAKSKPFDKVYILSDDIWFQFLVDGIENVEAITPNKYAIQFVHENKSYDTVKFLEFYSLVKNKKLEKIEHFNLDNVNINEVNPDDGLTPLIAAVRNRDIRILNYLLGLKDTNSDVLDKHKYKFSAVQHATQLKHIKMIKILVEAGADCDLGSSGKNSGNTPLMVAAWSGFDEAVEYYVSQGACVNQQDNNGYTPLMKACIRGNMNAVRMLVQKTDLNIRSRENKTAVEYLNPKKVNRDILSLFKGDK